MAGTKGQGPEAPADEPRATAATSAKPDQMEKQGKEGDATVARLTRVAGFRYVLAGVAFFYSLFLAWHLVCYLVDGFTGMLTEIDKAKLWAAAPWILVGKALVVGAVLTFCGALLRFAERMTVPLWIELKRQQDAADEKQSGLALSTDDVKKIVLGLIGKASGKGADKD